MTFEGFPKIARLRRDMIVTEKIDGTNASVEIVESMEPSYEDAIVSSAVINGFGRWRHMFAGSRTRYITPTADNFGFAAWVKIHAEQLLELGVGRHFGEWWGSGIQRGYGLTNGEKRFSLFNTFRWSDDAKRPACCSVVPVLATGTFDTIVIDQATDRLRFDGSSAAPGFMNPEGIVVFHSASGQMFKRTLLKDEKHKGEA
jgi:hypothetical protein